MGVEEEEEEGGGKRVPAPCMKRSAACGGCDFQSLAVGAARQELMY